MENEAPKALREAQIAAMEAFFAFNDAMNAGELSINDLSEIMSKAIEDGFDMLELHLGMANIALGIARAKKAKKDKDVE